MWEVDSFFGDYQWAVSDIKLILDILYFLKPLKVNSVWKNMKVCIENVWFRFVLSAKKVEWPQRKSMSL